MITSKNVLAAARSSRTALRGQAYRTHFTGATREVIVATVVQDGSLSVCRKTHIGQDFESWSGGAYGTTYVPQKGQTAAAIAEAIANRLNAASDASCDCDLAVSRDEAPVGGLEY